MEFLEGLKEIRDGLARITGGYVKTALLIGGFITYLFLRYRATFLWVVQAAGEYIIILVVGAVLYWFGRGVLRAQTQDRQPPPQP